MSQADGTRGGQRGFIGDAVRSPIGFEQITDVSSAVGLTAGTYDGATYAQIQAQDQDVRGRDDGTNPTTSGGLVLFAGQSMNYFGDLSAIKFIEEAASAKLNVAYYGPSHKKCRIGVA